MVVTKDVMVNMSFKLKRKTSSNGRAVDFHLVAPSSNICLGTLRIEKDAHATYHSIFVVLCDSKNA